jgi:glycosyltransferase involved in cell wall biosynthesis
MASGLACIGTTVDGIPEAIINDRVGFLVKPKDTVTLKEAMLRCANMSEEDRIAMGKCARDHVEKFHHHDQYAKWLKQLYIDELAKATK